MCDCASYLQHQVLSSPPFVGPLCTCSAFTAMSNKCLTFGTIPEHVAPFRDVEKRDKFASMFWSAFRSHVLGDVNLSRILEATSCQVVAKTVKGFWTALSENIRCHGVSDNYVSQLNVWCCLYRILRQSAATLTSNVCAFLLNMRHNWQQRYPGCISTPRRTSTIATSRAHECCDSGKASPPATIT